MALKASLMFGDNSNQTTFSEDNSYALKDFRCEIFRVHKRSVSVQDADYVKFIVSLNSPQCSDLRLQEWYSKGDAKEGKIQYHLDDVNQLTQKTEEILFYNAYCIGISERYDKNNNISEMELSFLSEGVNIDKIDIQ